jgi:hypothetical protein
MKTSLNVGGRGGARRSLAVVVALLVTVMAGLGLVAAGSASAHSGGKAIVLVENLYVAPAGDSWKATAKLADYDGGGALTSVDATLVGAGLTKATPMVEISVPGTYELALPKAKPGPVDLTLDVRTLPGGTPVTTFSQKYSGTLVDGQTLSLTTGKVASSGGGGSNTGMIVGVAGAVLLVAVLYGLFSVRKKSAVPAPSK